MRLSTIIENSMLQRVLLILGPLLVFLGLNFEGLSGEFSFILGLIALPYVIQVSSNPGGYRFAFLSALIGLVLLFYRSNSVYYFTTVFLIFFVLDNWWGRLNMLPILLSIIISPVLGNIVYLWSFPIRLELTQLAAKTLNALQLNIEVNGNLLLLDGNSFSVDPACIGLKLLITSQVLALVLIAYYERKQQKSVSLWHVLLLLFGTFLGAVFANFTRLLLLILFHILPDNPLHDVVGMLSLGLYVLLPLYLIIPFLLERASVRELKTANPSVQKIHLFAYVLLFGLQIYNGLPFLNPPVEDVQAINGIEIPDFERSITPNGVLKLQNEEALIYIKPPVQFFQGAHDPRFCWQGSGYTFSEVQLRKIGDKEVYLARLEQGKDQLYTAWWYENQSLTTPHEWTWRLESLKSGSGFYMINITCEEKGQLMKILNDFVFSSQW